MIFIAVSLLSGRWLGSLNVEIYNTGRRARWLIFNSDSFHGIPQLGAEWLAAPSVGRNSGPASFASAGSGQGPQDLVRGIGTSGAVGGVARDLRRGRSAGTAGRLVQPEQFRFPGVEDLHDGAVQRAQ